MFFSCFCHRFWPWFWTLFWPKSGQKLAKSWPKGGQKLAKSWPKAGFLGTQCWYEILIIHSDLITYWRGERNYKIGARKHRPREATPFKFFFSFVEKFKIWQVVFVVKFGNNSSALFCSGPRPPRPLRITHKKSFVNKFGNFRVFGGIIYFGFRQNSLFFWILRGRGGRVGKQNSLKKIPKHIDKYDMQFFFFVIFQKKPFGFQWKKKREMWGNERFLTKRETR